MQQLTSVCNEPFLLYLRVQGRNVLIYVSMDKVGRLPTCITNIYGLLDVSKDKIGRLPTYITNTYVLIYVSKDKIGRLPTCITNTYVWK